MMKSTFRWKFIAAVMTYSLICRVLPYVLSKLGMPIDPENTWYPWNFSPVPAACVFCGAVVPKRGWAFALPLGLMIVGDLLIDLIMQFEYASIRNYSVQLCVYGCVMLVAWLGSQIRSKPGLLLGMPTAVTGEIFFFILTNFAVWASGVLPGKTPPLYVMDLSGLWNCYAAALPYFGKSLLSTAVYAGLFFSPWGLGLAGVTPPSAGKMEPAPVLETVHS